jgi:hypothetical protein
MRKRRISMAGLIAMMAVAIAASPVLATSDNVSGHLHHDATITYFTTWRLHTGGHIDANLNNGPNANKNMRMGLRGQDGAQFSSSQEWSTYPQDRQFTDWSGVNTFSQRWFAINARMVDPCGIFCDDDFGGTINFSV